MADDDIPVRSDDRGYGKHIQAEDVRAVVDARLRELADLLARTYPTIAGTIRDMLAYKWSAPREPATRRPTVEELEAILREPDDAYKVEIQPDGSVRAVPREPATGGGDGFDMRAHLERQREWSERTFGPGSRAAGVVDHIRKELREIEASPGDLEEWIDVVILALDGAWRSGASPDQIIAQIVGKQTKNEARQWPDWRTVPHDKAIEHEKASTPPRGVPVGYRDAAEDASAPAEPGALPDGWRASLRRFSLGLIEAAYDEQAAALAALQKRCETAEAPADRSKTDVCGKCGRGWSWVDGNQHRIEREQAERAGFAKGVEMAKRAVRKVAESQPPMTRNHTTQAMLTALDALTPPSPDALPDLPKGDA